MECIEADIGRLLGKELDKQAGISEGCQAKRQAGIEAGMYAYRHVHYIYRLAGKELTKTQALQHASLSFQ
jgi:hypothetical protein